MPADDTLTGNFGDFPLPSLLATIASSSRSGVLRISGGGEIWFDNGAIYLAQKADGDPVASVLFGAGVSSLDEINELLRRPEGDAAGALADRDPDAVPVLERLLHEHNLDALFEIVVPSEAEFSFEADVVHPVGSRFAEPADELIAQAERRLQLWSQIATRIPTTSVVFGLSSTLPDGDEERLITADEWRYLALLDGRTSVADVINKTGESAFRVCSSLYRLILEGLIDDRPSA